MLNEVLPFTRDISMARSMTWAVAILLLLSSIAGLLYGPRGWYDPEAQTYLALLGQDAISVIFVLPLLVVSALLAQRGSMRGLICWMGALFYIAYFYYFNVLGIRFNPLFPIHIAIVSISMYALLALFFSLDPERVKARFSGRMPTRMIAGFLITMSLSFAVIWSSLIVSRLASAAELDAVTRLVIAIDGVVLLPVTFFAGRRLWRREPLGYVLSGLLLVKLAATFLTLVATTLLAFIWGQTLDSLLPLYLAGLIGATLMLARTLRSIETSGSASRDQSLIDRFIAKADVRESDEILVRAPASAVFDVAQNSDLLSVPIVHAIFRLREILFRVKGAERIGRKGLVEETRALGWGVLAFRPGRELVMGAVTQPWFGVVKFRAIPPEQFAAFAEPDFVKIVWTLEVDPLGPGLTRFRTQTRVEATDEQARMKFRRYWLKVGNGIRLIRWSGNRAIRREAERRVHGTGFVAKTTDAVWGALQIAFHVAMGPLLHGWRTRWGATADEISSSLPGDKLIPKPDWSYNHGITIHAPRSAVWPWLVQIGQARGGLYSYEGLENLIGCDIHNVWEIRPELQKLEVGDTIRLYKNGFGPPVAIIQPASALILGGPPDATGSGATWSFYLLDGAGGTTRLLERGRSIAGKGIAARLGFGPYLIDPIGFVMSRKMLKTIKRLAENGSVIHPPALTA